MAVTVEEKSIVPTVLVGVGGTGNEILSRVRRLVEESYGSLANFPLISFLVIDTDKDYKITNPIAAGSQLKDHEKLWANVSGQQVRDMMDNMSNYPWIESWFPTELERNLNAIEAGAGQIRGYGRFAYFCNYHKIQKAFEQACNRVKSHEKTMLDKYNIKVTTTALNVFVIGSLSGGTGSGMLIDLAYSIRHWLKGQTNPLITGIAPLPAAFAAINVGDRVKANGYAALMELSYFSDHRTEYNAQYSNNLTEEIRDRSAPFDFTYLVGTKNGESEFTLDQVRELISQNIFLDLTSDFAPHKRSIRDNIKGAWAQADPGGRSYPKNFMSFGLSTMEIPIAQIRTSLANRLAADFVNWWLNESALLPSQLYELIQNDILKRMRLTDMEMLTDLSAASDKSYLTEISGFVNSIRQQINQENLLQCTQQGIGGVISAERGKILGFVNFLQEKVEQYRADHLRELSPDERSHGDFFLKMYDNRNRIIVLGKKSLDEEFYRILEDRNRGPKFAEAFLEMTRNMLNQSKEKFRREAEKVWGVNEENRRKQYEDSLQDINQFKDKFGLTKQAQMEAYCDKALAGLEGSLIATIQRKARFLGLEVITRLEEHLQLIEQRFGRWNQKLKQARDKFKKQSDDLANSADALVINGIKLYDRQELNSLYSDLIEQYAGGTETNRSRYELGLDNICQTLSTQVLTEASPLWKQDRTTNEIMRLFDVHQLHDVLDNDWHDLIADRARLIIYNAPNSSRIQRELAAADRILKINNNDDAAMRNQIAIAFSKSQPIILLNQAIMRGRDAGFTPAQNTKVAIVGGRNPIDPATTKLLPLLQERVGSQDAVTPLGNNEKHRIVFVQEIGGFSLRCIDGMRELRQSYQDWKGQTIQAKRAQLRGESKDPPIPVHIQKEPPFWDIFPENPDIYKLVVQARSLKILRIEENRQTKENVVRYTRKTVIGQENVDIASSWEEAVQVLDVLACREDREEIQKQVQAKFIAAESATQKQALYEELMAYLGTREIELEKEGGKDSLIYKREAKIMQDVIEGYKLIGGGDPPPPTPTPTPSKDHVFCTKCGTQNPVNSKFCFKCGNKLNSLA